MERRFIFRRIKTTWTRRVKTRRPTTAKHDHDRILNMRYEIWDVGYEMWISWVWVAPKYVLCKYLQASNPSSSFHRTDIPSSTSITTSPGITRNPKWKQIRMTKCSTEEGRGPTKTLRHTKNDHDNTKKREVWRCICKGMSVVRLILIKLVKKRLDGTRRQERYRCRGKKPDTLIVVKVEREKRVETWKMPEDIHQQGTFKTKPIPEKKRKEKGQREGKEMKEL